MSDNNFEDGVYALEELDVALKDSIYKEMRYINKNNNTRLVKFASSKALDALKDYVKTHNIDRSDKKYMRVLFDVYLKNNHFYIQHFKVCASVETIGPIGFSPQKNYPIFSSKFEALAYVYIRKNNNSKESYEEVSKLRAQLEKKANKEKLLNRVEKISGAIAGGITRAVCGHFMK